LQWFHDKSKKPDFAHQLAELDAFLKAGVVEDHPLAGAVALPTPPEAPQGILLGGSPESAALAAKHGWQFCYAGHFNGDSDSIERSIDVYRNSTGRAPLLALYAFAAVSKAEAQRHVGPLRIFKLRLATGQSVNLPSPEAAAEFTRQTGVTDYKLDELHPHVITGRCAPGARRIARTFRHRGICDRHPRRGLRTAPRFVRGVVPSGTGGACLILLPLYPAHSCTFTSNGSNS
jgi:alkanesulfonate monooxygenase SsuD/methylene tetrahydromethanopterin reductase-like flavin-dependent oxidoreductase (luciferase family)